VEHDIAGNHVLKNAAALVFAGAVIPESGTLESPVSASCGTKSVGSSSLTGPRGAEHFLPSGVRQDLVDAAELPSRRDCCVPLWLADALARAREWEAALTGPDGRLPLRHDAWEGPPGERTAESARLKALGERPGRFRDGRDHAADLRRRTRQSAAPPTANARGCPLVRLLGGRRPVVVDLGSYAYAGLWRNRFRGTAAHDTVEVDGADQCVL
jgi:hypothetical protein